ncbi:HK97 family phage prohead protease [Mesorhizobium sp. WSM4887]|uniref:HK97 family phage prohead protease n=1 Tax=Mesorhizobium sp. WSM4887 TaxID=3038543 RepID=UPI0024161678|nr:HK97 family phage prohead protease [Mesorhizobium sp. WSM4887]MDG4889281.1 HK97 family phage prohead protease [Mesorhizobium sp. WSM4887]
MDRAYSVITVKQFDPKKRTFSGWATTPAVDRVGDIIEPLGVKAAPDLPLLLHHDSKLPVGRAFFNKPTKAGVTFRAEIPKIEAPGVLRDRTEEAWQSVESGLIRAVSVGFRPLENGVERMASGGIRFKAVEVMELSLVAIPANEEATIANVKRFELGGRETARTNQKAIEEAFLKDVGEVVDLLTRTYKFEDIAKPLSTRLTFDLFAQLHVMTDRKCDRLEARIRELEAGISSGTGYKGVFQKQIEYRAGDLVTSGGSLWHANVDIKGIAPGESPMAWTLCAKSGNDVPKTVRQMRRAS